MPPAPMRPLTIAAYLSAETDNGRELLHGLGHFSREHPRIHVVKFTRSKPLTLAAVRTRGVDGVIATLRTAAEARGLRRLGLPLVNLTGETYIEGLPTVRTDDLKVGLWAARYFQHRGYRHLAYCDNRAYDGSRLRGRGMRLEALRLGTTFHRLNLSAAILARRNPQEFITRLRRWVRSLPKPVGIFVSSDNVALLFTDACEAAGLRIPQDVALLCVSVDSTRQAFARTEISSIELNSVRIGRLAGELLLDLLQGRPPRSMLIEVAPLKIITRRSSDQLAVDDELVTRALEFIREHAGNPLSVDEVARAAGSSRRRLELRFRHAVHRSIYAEIQRQHFARAVHLMSEPEHSLGEIAYAAGFSDARHLSIAFRTQLDITPTEYRTRLLQGTLGSLGNIWPF